MLVLGLSVFSWALQARLPVSTAHGLRSNHFLKLSVDEASLLQLELRDLTRHPAGPVQVLRPCWLALLFHGQVVFVSDLRQNALRVCGPHRHETLGAAQTHLPPPAQA